MFAKGSLDYFWRSDILDVFVFEFFTGLSILPVLLISDFIIHLFMKRERMIYLCDMLAMLISIPFIAALWRGNPGSLHFWTRALYMMRSWTDVKILYGPLLVATILGYLLYVWTLSGKKPKG
jgi:hypothetical protein